MNMSIPMLNNANPAIFENQKVLVREDFNVPMSPDGHVVSNYRLQESLPTIQYLLQAKAKVIILSHLGRPNGKITPEFSLKPVADELQKLLPGVSVNFTGATEQHAIQKDVESLQAGEVLLLENMRFEAGEEKNDPAYSQFLASLGDIYINDAFGTAHRAHSSTEGIAHYVKNSYAGLLMGKELTFLNQVLNTPKRPLTAIIGGSKISTKIAVLNHLLPVVDNMIIGGAMVFTFLKAQGYEVGKSLWEPEFIETAKEVLAQAKSLGKILYIPTDFVIAPEMKETAPTQVVKQDHIPSEQIGLDVGPESTQAILELLASSETVLWNGPLGVFEMKPFAEATFKVAKALAENTKAKGQITILGGGDTQAAIQACGLKNMDFSHVSTGGGASLEYLEGKALPGVVALCKKELARCLD